MAPTTDFSVMGLLLSMLNGFWAVLALSVTVLFVAYLWREARTSGFKFRAWWHGDMPINMQLAVAIVVVHAGNFGVRGILWFWRYVEGTGGMYAPTALIALLAAASVVAIIGELCIMRVVSRAWLGSWPWLVSVLLAAAFVLATLPL